MVLEELVTYAGKGGRKRATIFFEKEYILPYKVEYYSENNSLGWIHYLTKESAEEAAEVFAFEDFKNGNSDV